jgi:hypothetical protein
VAATTTCDLEIVDGLGGGWVYGLGRGRRGSVVARGSRLWVERGRSGEYGLMEVGLDIRDGEVSVQKAARHEGERRDG